MSFYDGILLSLSNTRPEKNVWPVSFPFRVHIVIAGVCQLSCEIQVAMGLVRKNRQFSHTAKIFFKIFMRRVTAFVHKIHYGYNLFITRGKAMVSLMWSSLQIHMTRRSTPIPKPACGMLPYLLVSRYHS